MKIDKKYYPMLALAGGIVLLLIIIVIVMLIANGGNKSYSYIENKMLSAAQSYYSENMGLLPKDVGDQSKVDLSTLVSGSYMKEPSDYKEGASCSGEVIVTKISAGNDYVVNLKCGEDYKTKFLLDVLVDNVVTSGEGLYNFDDVAKASNVTLQLDEDGYDLSENPLLGGFVYRGKAVKNYIKIGEVIFRIVKIDKNGDFLIVLDGKHRSSTTVYDDSYNSITEKRDGYSDYSKSNMKSTLNKLYDALSDDSMLKEKVVPKNICIGGRLSSDYGSDGKHECSKVFKGQNIAMLSAFDVMNASLDPACASLNTKECINYNYLFDYSMMTMTPTLENNYQVYAFDTYNGFRPTKLTNRRNFYYTLSLSNRVLYVSGDGTKDNPYIVK